MNDRERKQTLSTFKRFQTRWEDLRDWYASDLDMAEELRAAARSAETWALKVSQVGSFSYLHELYAVATAEVVIEVGSYEMARAIGKSLGQMMNTLGKREQAAERATSEIEAILYEQRHYPTATSEQRIAAILAVMDAAVGIADAYNLNIKTLRTVLRGKLSDEQGAR